MAQLNYIVPNYLRCCHHINYITDIILALYNLSLPMQTVNDLGAQYLKSWLELNLQTEFLLRNLNQYASLRFGPTGLWVKAKG